MIIFLNDQHDGHQGNKEMYRGEFVPCFEVAGRLNQVVDKLHQRKFGEITAPHQYSDKVLSSIHSPRYVEFLSTAWEQWLALDADNANYDALPAVWPVRHHRSDKLPDNFSARMGLFSFDMGTPLTQGTWQAARQGAWCALSAAEHLLAGNREAFALSRPPGHHAGADFFGGYCFLNNAALAAQRLRDGGASRVAILDIDYHHGNGTQTVFYDRDDVIFLSLHANPATDYPFYLGYADERGEGAGWGFNKNYPLQKGANFEQWHEALSQAMTEIAQYRADALVVSLGVDTFKGDPIAGFNLQGDDFLTVGATLAGIDLPTVFVFEGGYDLQTVGENTVNVLLGFQS